MKNKPIVILSYVLVGLFLLPVAAIALYLSLGLSLFLVLFLIDRIKYGRSDPSEAKTYKIASTVLFVIVAVAVYFVFGTDAFQPFTWKGYFFLQGISFISVLPLSYFYFTRLKSH